jgi:4-amino-4-deoxy-L-arabinose transferase-like glycosyltransferase
VSRLYQQLRLHWPAILVALTFFLLATIYSVAAPIFEAPDELWHYPFVWRLARTWELPAQDPAQPELWRQEGSQPPLYYALAALLTAPIPTDDLPDLIYPNPQADVGLVSPDGNANIVVHTSQENWPWSGAVLAIHIVRFFSVLLGTGTVLTVYALGRTLWPQRRALAWLAMSFVAFNPMFLFISGSINNDNLITFLAALTLWQLVQLVVARSDEPSDWQLAGLGILVGLAALTKVSGLGLLGLVGITLLVWGVRRRSWHTIILGNGLVGLMTIAIAGWWYWRNVTLYGDWSGAENMIAMMGGRPVSPTLEQLLAEVPGLLRSFWGLFGYFSVPLPTAIYWLLNLLLVTGLVGLLTALINRSQKLPPYLGQAWPILLGWIGLMLVGLLQWTLRTPATQGRLLFPALAGLAILWAAGWIALAPRPWYVLPVLAMFVLAVWVPWGVIRPAYAHPASVVALPPSVQRLGIIFGDKINLLGYENKVAAVQPGETLPLTLYWRGESPLETDYVIFIHLVDENNLIIAQRDVFHGPGVYPTSQWEVGEQFGDTYILRLPNTTFAPAQAHFEVGLYDSTSGARLSTLRGTDSVQFGAIEIQPRPGEFPNSQVLLFEDGLSLVGYSLDRQVVKIGQGLILTLYWQSQNTPGNDYKVFVHLVDDKERRIAQHDSEPQGGAAPTSGWQPGQVVVDEHPLTISPDALPGAYRLVVGLYKSDTGQRLRLLRENGRSVQANSVILSGIRVIP